MLEQQQRQRDREYAEYLLASDLSSPTSENELEIALAHGLISAEEYERHQRGRRRALGEGCSAMEMLSAANKERERAQPWYAEWENETYGSIDVGMGESDEESPCAVGMGASGGRLRPFDF